MVYTIRFSRCFASVVDQEAYRRRRDLNPRAAINDLLPFQGSPFSLLGTSPSGFFLKLKQKNALGTQRRGWDSNPCAREGKRFSRPPRYDHFDTSPWSCFPIILRRPVSRQRIEYDNKQE